MYFFALSQAPPPVHIEIATKRPVTIVPISTPPSARMPAPGPSRKFMPKPTTTGIRIGSSDGTIISLDRGARQHVDGPRVVGLGRAFHDALDLRELAPHLDHDGARRAADGFHRHRAEQVGHQAADEEADDDGRVGQAEELCSLPAISRLCV